MHMTPHSPTHTYLSLSEVLWLGCFLLLLLFSVWWLTFFPSQLSSCFWRGVLSFVTDFGKSEDKFTGRSWASLRPLHPSTPLPSPTIRIIRDCFSTSKGHCSPREAGAQALSTHHCWRHCRATSFTQGQQC